MQIPNPRSRKMGKTIAILGGVAAVAASALLALPAQASTSLYVQVAPPAARYEAAPGYRQGHEWVAGHWQWQGNGHAWAPGYWVVARPGYSYRQPQWVSYDNRWGYQPGGWIQIGGSQYGSSYYGNSYYDNSYRYNDRYSRSGRRDLDRDGIPDRRDRDLDNDGRPNSRDRDRDGDGVPNYRDRRPDNRYRY
jgi:hypothetical protein